MTRSFVAILVAITLCVSAQADIMITAELYEVGTNTPLSQPIMVGDMFDVVYTATDTIGPGLAIGTVEWTFDSALVSQDVIGNWGLAPPLSGYSYLVPDTAALPTGGIVEFTNSGSALNPFEMVRIKYTADAVGSAVFTTMGFVQGNPPDPNFSTFATEDGRAFFPDGQPANMAAMGEVVTFGQAKVNIVPEPANLLLLGLALIGFVGIRMRSR